jgi:hypothetical protein
MSVQNPTIPTPTQAKAIDSVIYDLQLHLDTELSWLTNGMGRAYRHLKVRADQTTVFLPEVYLGVANRYDYFAATPDNDKQGQNIFFVGDAILPNQQKGFYGWVEHEVGIIFSANLETIDSALLVTEDFTEHLIQDVREALIRDLVGKSYRLNIDSITREFDDVYAEFDVARDRGIAHAPMTHFRVNCTITFKEDCAGVSLDRCAAILQNLSTDDLLNCILPTYDFSTTAVQNATTAQQQADMTAWLCSPCPPGGVNSSYSFDGVNEYVHGLPNTTNDFERTDAFSMAWWFKGSGNFIFPLISKYTGNRGYLIRVTYLGNMSVILGTGTVANGRRIDALTTTGVFNPAIWNHFAVTYDGGLYASGLKIYINGVSIGFTTSYDGLNLAFTMTNPTIDMEFAANTPNTTYGAGWLYDAKIWNTDLSAAQVLNQYNEDNTDITAGRPPDHTEATINLVDWCKFGKEAGYGRGSNWCDSNSASTTAAGYDSANMEKTDRDEVNIPT